MASFFAVHAPRVSPNHTRGGISSGHGLWSLRPTQRIRRSAVDSLRASVAAEPAVPAPTPPPAVVPDDPRRQKGKLAAWTSISHDRWEGELQVDGEIPPWLNGTYLRLGPGIWHVDDYHFGHLFDGFGTLVRLHFDDGFVAASHRQIESEAYKSAKKNNYLCYHEYSAVPNPKGLMSHFRQLTTFFSGGSLTDNANNGIFRLGDGRILCLTETITGSIVVDPDTLETVGRFEFADRVGGMVQSPHPVVTETEFLSLVPDLVRPGCRVVRMAAGSNERKEVGRVDCRGEAWASGWVHSFPVTENYVVVPEMQLRYSLRNLLLGIPRPLEWLPDSGSFMHVMCRASGKVLDLVEKKAKSWHEAGAVPSEPYFVARPGATKEDDGVIISLVSCDDGEGYALVLDGLSFEELARARLPYGLPYGFHGCWINKLMEIVNKIYPAIEPLDLRPMEIVEAPPTWLCDSRVSSIPGADINDGLSIQEKSENKISTVDEKDKFIPVVDSSIQKRFNVVQECITNGKKASENHKLGRYFYYDTPFSEDTGVWIPVSVPPMSESDQEEFNRGFLTNGAYFPDGDISWSQLAGEDKEMTMWDVVSEMLLAARGKLSYLTSSELRSGKLPWIPDELWKQTWTEMALTLSEASYCNAKEILDADPPKWLADSAATSCMLCNVRFHPIMRSRHHCRFCGGIFCSECSKGRCLLPAKFHMENPQRVCDVCCVRLECVQPYLMDHVSRASQLPTHDLIDLSTLRSWLNFPWGNSMEYEIYKAANTIRGYNEVGFLKPEKTIPDTILRHAKGLAILTVVKVGVVVTYNVGTGLVIARHEDGSWSPPSAISTFGIGWGAQASAGGEFTDYIIVLRTEDSIKNFCGNAHISVGAGINAAAGIVGRAAEADLHAGAGGLAACYTYSRCKGAFVGCSLEGSMMTTRTSENCRFYGSSTIKASDILLGSLPRPPAATVLYNALADLFQKLGR
ncbi:Carotenoid cleavage dioxygenase 8 like B, chloroplastic [Apostasia shenzhenica]|uniref:Carotenoid cleavage dioxygenase 8 like B, chloroplastic n=1 Tax=Apostasia shenzhenica TaxID=1088818 RepID=A0A2I0B9Y5_9ASPA|nr:Carotenoid cleavage dioxygenase 8 like B, chloroplastic [Apostasia shenzhenica]